MNDPEERYETLIKKMREKGSRMTSHRMAIARLLSVSAGHPNAAELYKNLKMQFPTISLATVYKTLTLLKEEGEVLEINFQEDSHYDGNKPYPHPHLVCTRCKRIFDGDDVKAIQKLNEEIAETYSFQIQHHQIVYFGICKECQAKPL